ncbi:MAG TPA: glycoside hydrolase family 2 TIM barrel-domain containing protein, partial [Clostridiales bacterium]|nr:glycoside hydrolase family 2 TIM barrel-domain containing protein [Clostridiales bacterium]
GIWQTVWMESVPAAFVEDLKIVPDIDKDEVTVSVTTAAPEFTVKVLENGTCLSEASGTDCVTLPMKDYQCWSPENPKLYDLEITAGEDTVTSYFGMRKFGVGPDKHGKQRLLLNNQPYFHNGVLDQGYWSDGMLTPPTKSAMEYDIQMLKSMGFNMIRKHIKIEPLYWYYLCDKEGMLVWQDMVNGGTAYNMFVVGILPVLNIYLQDGPKHYKLFAREEQASRDEYIKDMYDTLHHLKNVVSLAMWVPFNEGWGQFDANKIAKMIAEYDPTRTVNTTSGWHDQYESPFVTRHIYFYPIYVPKDNRCYLLDEFGGFSKMTKGHMFRKLLFGYRMYFTDEALIRAYEKTYEKRIIRNIKGLSATVFTQVSDVEGEINGLITYDRKVEKMSRKRLKAINDRVKLS